MKKCMVLIFLLVAMSIYSVEVRVFEERKIDDAYNEVVKMFEKENPDIKIKRIHYELNDIRGEVQKTINTAEGPALIFEPADGVGFYKDKKIIKDISIVKGLSKNISKNLVENGVKQLTFNGKIFGLPQTIGNHLTLLYNKDKVSTPPDTWSEMLNENYGTKYNVVFPTQEGFWLLGVLGGFGGNIFDAKNKISLDTPAMTKTLGFYQYLKFVKKAIPDKCDYGIAETMFLNGESAFIINGDWSFEQYKNKMGDKLGIASVPKLPGGDNFSPMTGVYGMYFVNGVNEDVERAAAKYVEFILRKDIQIYVNLKNSTLPVNKDALNSQEIKNNSFLAASAGQMLKGKPMPVVPEMEYVWKAVDINLNLLMNGEISPADAAEKMQEYAETMIKEKKQKEGK